MIIFTYNILKILDDNKLLMKVYDSNDTLERTFIVRSRVHDKTNTYEFKIDFCDARSSVELEYLILSKLYKALSYFNGLDADKND